MPRKRKVLVICGLGKYFNAAMLNTVLLALFSIVLIAGGTLKTTVSTKKKTFSDPDRGFGKESRSLKACYELIQASSRMDNSLIVFMGCDPSLGNLH